ncbi:MAG: demethoxyubiquinone hydroxylase family protein [Parvularculaceae bacterium]
MTPSQGLDTKRNTPGARDRRIAEMLRVDHAGEYGAVQIYRGQRAVFDGLAHKARVSRLLKEMEDGEAAHLETFDRLLTQRGVRPTLLAPFWNAAGFALGAATALAGEKSAMACTAAVEEVIEEHYGDQERELRPIEPALADTVKAFREDEIGHKTTAENEGADEAFAYPLLTAAIKLGCRVAIRLAEKV